MLNHFKIGQKLVAGFTFILLLLVTIWLVGRWASDQKNNALTEVEIASKLSNAVLSMQEEIFDAVISARDNTITREEKFAVEVREKTANIIKQHEKDMELMLEASEKQYQFILDKVREFAKIDAKYWDTEVLRKQARAARAVSATRATEVAEQLKSEVAKITQDQFKRTINVDGTDVEFYPVERVERERRIVKLTDALRIARRLCFQYECSRDAEERADLHQGFENEFTKIGEEIAALSEILVASKPTLELLDSVVKEWIEHTNDTIDLENKLTEFDADSKKLTDGLTANIGEVLVLFYKRAADAEEAAEILDNWVQWVQFFLSIGAIIFGIVISWVLKVNITSGLTAACKHLQNIAREGDVSVEVPEFFLGRKDEVGDIAHAVKEIQDHFQHVERLAGSLANYDYSVELKVLGDKDTMSINLNHMIKEISNAVHEISEDAKRVATGSNEVSSAAQGLSSGSQQMAASLEEITATMHEISGQTKTNAESAAQARDLAQASSKVAVEGQTVMHELIGAMERITENSNEIQRVIKVVDDIAFQTNLLALNAAVEAARAGQHGKGFAVVAEEVRNLASRSAKAAQETSELIAKSSQEIQRGDEIAAHTAGVFDTIVEQIKQTTDLVGGIAIASNEQAQGVGQVSIGLQQIDGVTQTNSASAEESASAASEMTSMAKNLQGLVAKFKLRESV